MCSVVSIDTAIEHFCLEFQCITAYYNGGGNKPNYLPGKLRSEGVQLPKSR